MKSYTNIEQSRKLAEILPIESADCCYFEVRENGEVIPTPGFMDIKGLQKEKRLLKEVSLIPCWSLSALLNVMPKDIKYFHTLTMDFVNTHSKIGWRIGYCNEHWSFKKEFINTNPVFAAYECICWLFENKLIEKKSINDYEENYQ